MKVLLLSPHPDELRPVFAASGDRVVVQRDPLIDFDPTDYEWVVSYGYRHILRGSILDIYKNRILNLHLSLLPWNRGADPNFWSWYDNTPKGVTLHVIDAGIDTGPFIAQRQIYPNSHLTLRESYEELRATARALFADVWSRVRRGNFIAYPLSGGSHHNSADKTALFEKLTCGYDSTGNDVMDLRLCNA